jgi:TonB family protein
MRRLLAFLAAAIIFVPPALAETPPADPALAFYPPAAEAAGIEGQATIRCGRDAQMKLTGCVLVSETPAGEGFGAAALALAATSQDNPKLNITNPALLKQAEFTVAFRLRPPSVDPDLSGMSHIVTRPNLAQAPRPSDMAPYVPIAAASTRGHVDLKCRVSADGHLVSCQILQETPLGLHLGDAATLIAQRLYRFTPGLLDGQPDPAAEVEVPIDFGVLPQSPRPPESDALLAFYPPAAKAAGVSGTSVLSCTHSEDGALTDCKVTSEAPAGYGFGAAALALAARSTPTCTVNVGQPKSYVFSFTAAPLRILPNVLDPAWSDEPHWLRQPSGDEFARLYPRAAMRAGLSGRAVLNCTFDATGHLRDCQVSAESPPGKGFAEAALQLATLFKAASGTCNGRTVEGQDLKLPISFNAPP